MADREEYSDVKVEVIKTVLRPFVRFCLRQSQSIQDITNLLKIVLVEEAEKKMEQSGEKVNVSRLSVITGIQRKDVTAIYREKKTPTLRPPAVLPRVVGQWRHDKRFTTKAGEPRILSYKGENNEFAKLVLSITTAINPGTILYELERSLTIDKTEKGVRLLRQQIGFRKYPREGFELLAKDIDALLQAGEENLIDHPAVSNLHLRTEYDNIFTSRIPEVRLWLLNEGKAFHKRVREFLSQYDKDINPSAIDENAGEKVIVNAFSFIILSPEKVAEEIRVSSGKN